MNKYERNVEGFEHPNHGHKFGAEAKQQVSRYIIGLGLALAIVLIMAGLAMLISNMDKF